MLGARANRFQIPGQLAIVVCYVEPHTNVILFGSLSRGIAVSRSLESQRFGPSFWLTNLLCEELWKGSGEFAERERERDIKTANLGGRDTGTGAVAVAGALWV